MSRVAKYPVVIPSGVQVTLNENDIHVKGSKGELQWQLHGAVEVTLDENEVRFKARDGISGANAYVGTSRALVNNMVRGVNQGFEKRLTLVGVGYRAQVQGKSLNLTLGFSHPVEYPMPDGITIETPSQTEIVVRGIDRQRVGQVAAEIRAYRPPEPYKGKGVRYSDEHVVRKEAKKK